MPRQRIPGLPTEAEVGLQEIIRRLEQRIAALEAKPTVPETQTKNFAAREGQFITVEAPASGISALLPKAVPANRGDRITFNFKNRNPVRLQSVDGLVNGVSSVISDRAGTFDAISDGETGWFVSQATTATGSVLPTSSGWPGVLEQDNNSGAFNPHIDTGQYIGFGDEASLPVVGTLRSSAGLSTVATGTISSTVLTSGNISLTTPSGAALGGVFLSGGRGVGIGAPTAPGVAAGYISLSAADRFVVTTDSVERLQIDADGAWLLASDAGDAGEVLTSAGAGAPPVWSAVALTSLDDVTGPTLLGLETGTGPPEELSGAQAGHLIKKAVDISVTVTTNQNDWAPTGIETADHIFVSTSGNDITITGIDGSSFAELEGTEFVVWLTSTGSITFSNNSASSSAGNRLLCPVAAGNTFRIGQQEGIKFRRNGLFWYALPHGPLLAGDAMGDRVRFDGVISATIAATTHNWSPSGLSTAHSIYLTLTGSQTLTGIDSSVFAGSGATAAGRSLLLHVTDASDTLTLSNNSVSSSVGNRFNGQTPAVNVKVRPGQTVWLRHESNFWVPRLLEGPLLTNQILANATTVTDSPQGLSISTNSFPARIAGNLVSHPFSTLAGTSLTYGSGAIDWDGLGVFDDTATVGTFRNLDFTSGTGISVTAVDNTLGTSTAIVGVEWDGATDLVADGDKGDITVSSGTWSIDANVVGANEIDETDTFAWTGVHEFDTSGSSYVGIGDPVLMPASGDMRIGGSGLISASSGLEIDVGTGDLLLDAINGVVTVNVGSSSGNGYLAITGDAFLRMDGESSSLPSAPSNGGIWWVRNDAASTPMFTDNQNEDWSLGYAAIDVLTSNQSATNTTGNLVFGSSTIQANTCRVGTHYKCTGYYVFDHAGGGTTPTLTMELLLGGSVVSTVVSSPIASANTYSGRVEAFITFRTVGASGTAMCHIRHDGNAMVNSQQQGEGSTDTTTTAVDTTSDVAISFRMRMTTAVASETLTLVQATIERIA